MGAEMSAWRAGVLNPWAGTGENGYADPLHPDWDEIDVERLRSVTTELLGNTNNGLLLWIPLRCREHLDRGAGGHPYGLGERIPRPDDLCAWFECSAPATLLLAQCGHLQAIDTERAAGPENLHNRVRVMHVARQALEWVGRYRDDREYRNRTFEGEIVSDDQNWSVSGIEALGSENLRQLRSQSDWPHSPQWQKGRHTTVLRKALAHAAVTVLRPSDSGAKPLGTRLRWAVFLPLDDHPEPRSSALIESDGPSPAWEVILHAYFWPSQDRRSIPGVTEDIGNAPGDGSMRTRWNRALCEELLFPLLPSALANAVVGVDERASHRLLDTVVNADMVKSHSASIRRRHWLLPIVTASGIRWEALDARSCAILSIPRWSQAPKVVRSQFIADCDECMGDVVFIDDNAPRIAGELDDWTDACIERLLRCISGGVFGSPQSLRWIEGFVRHVLGADACSEDIRAAAIARWLVEQIGDGALAQTTRRSASRELRKELRDTWRSLCEALPKMWLVETPVDSHQAVVELAAEGVFGEGLFPLPFGQRRDKSPFNPQLDQGRLDRALYKLGQRLKAGDDSERLRHSRLLLAEVLLTRRHNRSVSENLVKLPLLRAIRLPEDREEAWSIVDLRSHIEIHQVFASPDFEVSDYNGTDGTRPERLSDPKRAVTELANALQKPIWLVSGQAVASVNADVPSPAPEALARTVLQAESFADPANRHPLLTRLLPSASANLKVRWAVRVLLSGRAADIVGEDAELFHDRTGDGRVLRILLRLLDRSWCNVQGKLVEALSHHLLDVLSVSQANHQVLHHLLGSCLDKSVDWIGLNDEEALQLLCHLYGSTNEEQKRWHTMPLHRGVDGKRGAFNQQSRRSTGKTDELRLPPELQSEVRLLDPEPQVAHLYTSVPDMDSDGILQLMLEYSRPWRFAEQIIRYIRTPEGSVSLPRDSELRTLFKRSRWLPQRDDGGLAPDAVLVAPKELLDAVSGLEAVGVFGNKQLPEAIDSGIWRTAEPVVREIHGRPNRERQLQRLADVLDSDQVGQVDCGAYLLMPNPVLVDTSLIEDAMQTTLAGSHTGWKIVHTAIRVVGHGDDQSKNYSEPLVKLAKSLCAPIPSERQIEILTNLATSRPAKGSPGGRLFRRYLECFAETDDFFTHVLPKLDLPTQDGNWHASQDVARSEYGVARRHRLITELRPILQLRGDDAVRNVSSVGSRLDGSGLDALQKYFEPWRGRVSHGAVGAFLSLLGNGLNNVIRDTAQQWLGEDVAIDLIEGSDRKDVSVWVSPQVACGDRVSAVNVLGSRVMMEAEADDDTLFAVDPVRHPPSQVSVLAPLGAFSEIALRDVEPQTRSPSELIRLLGGTVERWASQYLELPRDKVNTWWSRWGKGSQADFGPVLASIKAHLPLTLQQLDVKESEPLRDALREAERAQRKREQALSEEALKLEREALDSLAALIDEPQHREFLWKRVYELMRRYGYGQESVLLELAQNADDALAEAAEIEGRPLPLITRHLLIRVHEHDGTPTVDVVHWGRPINDTGGAAFPVGRKRQWDQDLYFMMLMNLSGKPGEAPGESLSSSTTGRFGLGFKSVHLVSSSPAIVSGFISFSIAGGLLPQEGTVAGDMDSLMVEGRWPTRVRLPLRPDVEADVLIERLFGRFVYAHALLPVFARQIRQVVVEGGPFPGVHVFDGKPIDGAPGWSIGPETEIPNHAGRWQILRFRPADAGWNDMGTAALAVGLREGVPTAFGPDVPFLWNVTPTSENWGCGYVINGPFKLDPGRTHVSLNDDTTLQAVGSLGDALGKGLIELHDLLVDATGVPHTPMIEGDGRSFLSSLWEVLASGTDNPDKLRHKFLFTLHGNGRGLSAWMSVHSVVPTGLRAPFSSLLPPLKPGMSWEVAVDGLDCPDLFAVLAKIDDEDFRAFVGNRLIVSEKINRLLVPLCSLAGTETDGVLSTRFRPTDLLAGLAKRWDYRLTPVRLHALRPLFEGAAWDLISNDPNGATWRGEFQALSADGSSQPMRRLLVREASGLHDEADRDLQDEFLRAAIAPGNHVLDPAYIERSEDWRSFRWFRVQHRVDAAMIAKWCLNLAKDLYPAMIHYLLHGELGSSVLQHLVPIEGRPRWLREYDDVYQLVVDQRVEYWRRQSLLGALFPEQLRAPDPPPGPIQLESDTFFQHLLEWWDDDVVRSEEISAYEKATWPDWLLRDGIGESLRMGSVDHWLALLVLGACQSLGRTKDEQHRSFLELAHREGWWKVFKASEEPNDWMGVLRCWQDGALDKLTYPYWMSLFPTIYQLSRYRDVYVRLLKSAGRRPEDMYQVARLLAPRIDEALTGAGTRFDAPPAPLNMGIHWVLRELVRLKVVEGKHLFPDCWVPSEQVLRLLGELGLGRQDDGMSNSQKARDIFKFLASELGTETPNLHRAFDIPLRRIASNVNLRLQFGLE